MKVSSLRSLRDQPAHQNDSYNSISRANNASGRQRTIQTTANEEEVEGFVFKGWSDGHDSQSAAGFQEFKEATYIPVFSPASH